ncbi:MAG: diguanylate cyclase [Kangiellaceae bacterium]
MTKDKRFSDLKNIEGRSLSSNRVSLFKIFSAAFIGILLFFILVNTLIAQRLSDFQSILTQLSDTVLPKITLSGEAFNKVNRLTYLTARLASSPSQSFRLIAFRDIEKQIKAISDLELITDNDEVLKTQLDSIVNEFAGLNRLIEQRIQYQDQVRTQEKRMYELHDLTMVKMIDEESDKKHFSWGTRLLEIVTLSSKSLAVNRLKQVRSISQEIKQRFSNIREQDGNFNIDGTLSADDLAKKLESILVLQGGLLPTRIKELRSIGQATGRSNFVHNLVEDFSRQVQFQSHQMNDSVISNTNDSTSRVESETQLVQIITIVTFLFLAAVAYFLHGKIIRRLIILNKRVVSKIDGEDLDLRITGNDEISDIAHSFDSLIKEIEDQKSKLHELSFTDGLTGISNRRYLDKNFSALIDKANADNLPLSILIIDVDSFKNFNDHYGHLAGDDCLKMLAEAFRKSISRKEDFVARFGGEEFVFVLPNTNVEGASTIAEQILNDVISLKITHEWNSASPYVTISIGGATMLPSDDINEIELLTRADESLFKAKETGKNRLVYFSEKTTTKEQEYSI